MLVIADYAAIELRVIASLVKEPELLRCFESNIDPHTRTAAFVTGKSANQVTPDERQQAKPVNFGFLYGMGADTFMEYAEKNYGVVFDKERATAVKKKFLMLYREIAKWQHRLQCDGSQTRTASGRWRRLNPNDYTERLNTPVQGTAADGMKHAIVLLHPAIGELGGRIVNVVHDEVVAEVPIGQADDAVRLVEQKMIDGMREFVPDVPIAVKAIKSPRWCK